MLAVPACAALFSAPSSSTRVLNCSRPAASALRVAVVATCAFHQSGPRFDGVGGATDSFRHRSRRMPPRRRLGALCAAPQRDWAQCARAAATKRSTSARRICFESNVVVWRCVSRQRALLIVPAWQSKSRLSQPCLQPL